jgi:hypothetical protein
MEKLLGARSRRRGWSGRSVCRSSSFAGAARSGTTASRWASWFATASLSATALASLAATALASLAAAALALAMATTTITVATAARAAVATVTTVTSNGHLLTANQGDADQRDQDREAHEKRAIHPRILQKSNRYLKQLSFNALPSVFPTPTPPTAAERVDTKICANRLSYLTGCPAVSLYGLGSLSTNAQYRVLG